MNVEYLRREERATSQRQSRIAISLANPTIVVRATQMVLILLIAAIEETFAAGLTIV